MLVGRNAPARGETLVVLQRAATPSAEARSRSRRLGLGAALARLLAGFLALGAGALPAGAPPLEAPHAAFRAPSTSGAVGPPVTVEVDAARLVGRPIDEALIGTNQAYLPAGPLVRALGPDWARTDASLEGSVDGKPVYDCATGAWNPALLASNLAADQAEGGVPEVIVDYSPSCLTTSVPPGTNPAYAPPDADNWRPWEALVFTMARYAIGKGVRVFEVWNEPDWVFFDGDLPAYLELYLHTARALEAAAKAARVHIAVGGPATVTADPVWIGALARFALAHHLPLSFVSWHDYANDPAVGPFTPSPAGELPPPPPRGTPPYWYNPAASVSQYATEAELVRRVLAATPALHPELVVDEWNLDAGYDPRMDEPYEAAFVAAVLAQAQRAGIARMCFFRVTDSQHGNPYDNWGMLGFGDHGRLVPKPAYPAFLFWHELAGEQVAARASQSPPGTISVTASVPPGAIAEGAKGGGQRLASAVSVLVSDFVAYDPTGENGTVDPNPYGHLVDLELEGLEPGRYALRVQRLDATFGARRPVTTTASVEVGHSGTASLRLGLPGSSVLFLEATSTR